MTSKAKLMVAVLLGTVASTPTAFAQYVQMGQPWIPSTNSGLTRQSGPAVPDYFGSMWNGFTPEQKFGAFIEAFWAFARQNTGSVNCRPDEPNIRSCLARQGYTFQSSYPAECKVSFAEQIPTPTNVQKTWDGQAVGLYPTGHRLTIDLHSLNRKLINNSFKLYFDERTASNVRIEVKLSSSPNEWLSIPNPPSLSDVPANPNENDRMRALKQLRIQWGTAAAQKYGSGNLPYFAHFFPGPEALQAPPELLDLNNAFYTLSPPNRMQPVSLFSPPSAQNADALFVDALKSVIAKCPQQ